MIRHRPRRHFKALDSLSRINLLHELQTGGSRTITELGHATGLHPNTAREHLHRLIEAGLVRSEAIPRTGKGRPQLRYHAHLAPAPAPTGSNEVERQLDVLGYHMDQCGFDARIKVNDNRMIMRDCPFASLARDNPQVCAVHFVLLKGALESVNGPLRARELLPFTEPRECIVHLDAHDEAQDAPATRARVSDGAAA